MTLSMKELQETISAKVNGLTCPIPTLIRNTSTLAATWTMVMTETCLLTGVKIRVQQVVRKNVKVIGILVYRLVTTVKLSVAAAKTTEL